MLLTNPSTPIKGASSFKVKKLRKKQSQEKREKKERFERKEYREISLVLGI